MKILRICFFASALTVAANMAFADYVIYDDLIVDGSTCIGFDCVSGESFGYDTIRLKEHNLRIKFDDTSTAASYPRNDWQLTVNDSANGGLAKFSLEDITGGRTPFTIEAGARSHSLYVDDGGRIGSRTSTPSLEIHTIDGDTPSLRLQQDGSSGFAPQTWDVAGNESNFFIRDVTNGSLLPFRIRPDAPTSSIFIDTDGDIGLGTSSPDAHLEIERSEGGYTFFRLTQTGNTVPSADMTLTSGATQTGGSGSYRINLVDGDGYEMEIDDQGRLTVTGGYYVNTTALNVPDYVFSEDYNLRPLDEVQEFIADKGHLPEMPSAQEIEKSGLNMTDMQMRLLQKVEELTLYTLEQQQTIQQLKEEVALLKKRK
jgi:hypothetical protein